MERQKGDPATEDRRVEDSFEDIFDPGSIDGVIDEEIEMAMFDSIVETFMKEEVSVESEIDFGRGVIRVDFHLAHAPGVYRLEGALLPKSSPLAKEIAFLVTDHGEEEEIANDGNEAFFTAIIDEPHKCSKTIGGVTFYDALEDGICAKSNRETFEKLKEAGYRSDEYRDIFRYVFFDTAEREVTLLDFSDLEGALRNSLIHDAVR